MNRPYDYAELIKKFLDKKISVKEFEETYIDKFTGEKIRLNEFFHPLDWLFAEVDAYTDLPFRPGDNPNDHRTEEQLRKSAEETLSEIKKLGWQ